MGFEVFFNLTDDNTDDNINILVGEIKGYVNNATGVRIIIKN